MLYTDCCLALILGSAFANCPMLLKLAIKTWFHLSLHYIFLFKQVPRTIGRDRGPRPQNFLKIKKNYKNEMLNLPEMRFLGF